MVTACPSSTHFYENTGLHRPQNTNSTSNIPNANLIFDTQHSDPANLITKKITQFVSNTKMSAKGKKAFTNDLKKTFEKMDVKSLQELLNVVFSQNTPEQTACILELLRGSLELKKIEDVIRKIHPNFTTAVAKAVQIEKLFPAIDKIEDKKFVKEVKNTASVVANFFPHMIDTFLAAFNLLNVGKGPETIWDFAAMLEIYYKVFLIPHTLLNILSAVLIPTWQAFLIVLAIVVVLIALLYCYLKWLRPCPNKIPNCVNLIEEKKQGRLESVVGREEQINKVAGCLKNNVNILLIGEPGVGKSDIMMGAIKAYNGPKKIFSPEPTCFSNSHSSPAERFTRILNFVRGFENKVAFFVDELGEAIKKPDTDLKGFLKLFLGKRGGIQLIAAMTHEEYIKHVKSDKPLDERFVKIYVPPANAHLTRHVLDDRIRNAPQYFDIEPGVVDHIIFRTDTELKDHCQPRKAVQVLEQAMNRVNCFPENYVTAELRQKTEELQSLQRSFYQENSDFLQLEGEEAIRVSIKITKVQKEIEILEKQCKSKKNTAQKLQTLFQQKKDLRTNLQRSVKSITNDRKSSSASAQKDLLLNLFYALPNIEKQIAALSSMIGEVPCNISKELIDQIINGMESEFANANALKI